jgi:hypothetical protein
VTTPVTDVDFCTVANTPLTPAETAWCNVRKLEESGQLPLPTPSATVVVGTFNCRTGAFTFAVPTFTQTTDLPVPPSGKPLKPETATVGRVETDAVQLLIAFDLENVDAGTPTISSSFKTASTASGKIVLDAALDVSVPLEGNLVSPAVTVFNVTFTVNGKPTEVKVSIARPPVLGFGTFRIPVVPVALLCSPPPYTLKKNSNAYTVKTTATRSFTTAFVSSTSTKTAQAFTIEDILGKLSSLGAAAGNISGPAKGAGAAASALSAVLSGFASVTTSSTSTFTTESDFTTSLALTVSESFVTASQTGPPSDDKFVCLTDVLGLWMNINGDIGVTILDARGEAGIYVSDLLADFQALAGGGGLGAKTGLDAPTIHALLQLDPYTVARPPGSGSPLVPPRFTPLEPETYNDAAPVTAGAAFVDGTDAIADNKSVTTTLQTTITDAKPGWLGALFGSVEDNTETTGTVALTNSVTLDEKDEVTVTNTITMFSVDQNDKYDIAIFYDNLFGTLLAVDVNSSVLHGSSIPIPTPIPIRGRGRTDLGAADAALKGP